MEDAGGDTFVPTAINTNTTNITITTTNTTGRQELLPLLKQISDWTLTIPLQVRVRSAAASKRTIRYGDSIQIAHLPPPNSRQV